jgi:hypothetical protein
MPRMNSPEQIIRFIEGQLGQAQQQIANLEAARQALIRSNGSTSTPRPSTPGVAVGRCQIPEPSWKAAHACSDIVVTPNVAAV